jgi:hypothetical protein
MPILERAAPAAAPDTTTAAIEAIRAVLSAAAPTDELLREDEVAPEVAAHEEVPAMPSTVGHGPGHGAIRLRGRPVGPARGA